MDFLRRHVFFLGCGLACIAGIALGVTGLKAMPDVRDEMQKAGNLYQRLTGLQPVNKERLDAERRRIDQMIADRDRVMESAKGLYRNVVEPVVEDGETSYRYRLLVPDVFPNGEADARFRFRDKYVEAMEELLESLKSGGLPGPTEIANWQDRIEDERAAAVELGGVSDAPPSGPARTPSGVLTKAGARIDARARASIAAAQRIYCYAVGFEDERPPDRFASLLFREEMDEVKSSEAPELEDVWRAQISYWVQKDVVDAIVAVNSEAAEEAREQGEHAWVGVMPVKDVISIRVSPDYVFDFIEPNEPAMPGGYEPALPPGTPDSAFTGTASGGAFDTVHYTLKLVMDQRDIPLLVDRLCRNSFHTLLRVAYKAVSPNRDMVGKIYGSEPVVNVVLDFEVVMLGEVFRELMPDSVCEDYEITCPERGDEGEKEG